MKERIITGKAFKFSDAQKRKLTKELGKKGPSVEKFIADVEDPLTDFRHRWRSYKYDPAPAKDEIKRRMEEIRKIASSLHDRLDESDPDGEYFKIVEGLAAVWMSTELAPDRSTLDKAAYYEASLNFEIGAENSAEDDIDELLARLRQLITGIDWALAHHRSAKMGRHSSIFEVLLMENIAQLYKQHFGDLPAANSHGKYHKFIVAALACAGFKKKSWFRPLDAALKRLRLPPE